MTSTGSTTNPSLGTMKSMSADELRDSFRNFFAAKGHTPVIPLRERLEIVRSVRFVDAAFVETVPDKVETWQQVRFDVIFKGDDWRGTEKGKKLERDFAEVGVEVVYFPYTVHTSSTQLRRALDVLVSRDGALSAP
jgi:glycerol-3-phosphate cytidylyltransferase